MTGKMKMNGWLTAMLLITIFSLFSLTACGGPYGDVSEAPAVDPVTEEPAADSSEPQSGAAPDTNSLPRLPQLSSGNRGMGGGGAGHIDDTPDAGAAAEDMPVDMMPIWNPLADVQFTLNVPFPGDPALAAVYIQPGGSLFTQAEIQRYAQLFGISGPVYQEVFPEFTVEPAVAESPVWTPPPTFYIFDGQRQLSFYENTIYYTNQALWQGDNVEMMTFDQAAPIVEAFLRERGLLNFPYAVASTWGSDVEIRRIVDGYPSASAEFFVAVAGSGEIMSITYQPFDRMQILGQYPLRSAADAWQYVQDSDFDYQTSYWFTYPGPDFVPPALGDEVVNPIEDLYRYWPRRFDDGDSVVLVSYPQVYMATNNDASPRILIDQYLLNGSGADLEALAAYAGQPVRVEGVARGQWPNMVVELTVWQPATVQPWQYMSGAIRYDGEQVLFDADEGETFVVPDAPADIADGERVNLSGWSLEAGDGAYRVFNWAGMDRIVDWEALQNENTTPIDMPVASYEITDVVITEIDLTYQFSPAYGEDGLVNEFLMQPAWRFKGTTNTNEIIEILVQAAAPEFVVSSQ